MNDDSGLHGTDNVRALFPEKPSAAPLPPSPEVTKLLESFALKAASGKITGVVVLGFEDLGGLDVGMSGAIPFCRVVAALEQVKFGILARDYAEMINSNQGPK